MTLIDEQQIEVTCLECGSSRTVEGLTDTALGICPACGYVGWALAKDVNFAQLKTLRRLDLAFA
jgi:Zn finger protein HypA/HybF involved in hydrogenase expression